MAHTQEKRTHTTGEFMWNITQVFGGLILLAAGVELITD